MVPKGVEHKNCQRLLFASKSKVCANKYRKGNIYGYFSEIASISCCYRQSQLLLKMISRWIDNSFKSLSHKPDKQIASLVIIKTHTYKQVPNRQAGTTVMKWDAIVTQHETSNMAAPGIELRFSSQNWSLLPLSHGPRPATAEKSGSTNSLNNQFLIVKQIHCKRK